MGKAPLTVCGVASQWRLAVRCIPVRLWRRREAYASSCQSPQVSRGTAPQVRGDTQGRDRRTGLPDCPSTPLCLVSRIDSGSTAGGPQGVDVEAPLVSTEEVQPLNSARLIPPPGPCLPLTHLCTHTPLRTASRQAGAPPVEPLGRARSRQGGRHAELQERVLSAQGVRGEGG